LPVTVKEIQVEFTYLTVPEIFREFIIITHVVLRTVDPIKLLALYDHHVMIDDPL
jgi:hypothetical protein